MIKLLNIPGSAACVGEEKTGTIVGWNIKKTTIVNSSSSSLDGNHKDTYGLFVHIKVGDDQYTLVFDAFAVDSKWDSPYVTYTKSGNITLIRIFSWKELKYVVRDIKRAKRLSKSKRRKFIASYKDRTYPVQFKYVPTLLRLMDLLGADECVDIIGKNVVIDAIGGGEFLCTEIRNVSGTSRMIPNVFYVDTDNQELKDVISNYINTHPWVVVPNYGHENQE